MYLSDEEAKEMICRIGRKMYQKQFVNANDGNITIRTGENTVIATPTGVSKGEMTPDMLLKVDFDGAIIEGRLKPTSEIYMHLNVYKNNSKIMSTCHAHCMYLTAFATAGIELDLATSPETTLIVGKVPVAPFCCPGSKELAESVISYVNKYHMVLLANHGPLTWGTNPQEAWFRLEAAEAFAKSSVLTKYVLRSGRMLAASQITDVIENLKFDISQESLVTGVDKITNRDNPVSLSQIKTDRIFLEEASIDELAKKIVLYMQTGK